MTETVKEEVSKPVAVAITPTPITGSKSKKTILLCKQRIRCNGHNHEIGLASNGQLWIPSHTIKELDGFLVMGELGNNPCKCAVIYDAWRNINREEEQLPDSFKNQLIAKGRLPRRLLRHQNRKRHWPNMAIVFGTLHPPVDEKIYNWTHRVGELEQLGRFIMETVYKTLSARGYAKYLKADMGYIQYASDGSQLISFNTTRTATSIAIGGELLVNQALHNADEVPWRLIIDATESTLLRCILHKYGVEHETADTKDYENLATDEYLGELPKNTTTSLNRYDGTVDITTKHTGLTIQVARLLLRYYRNTQDLVVKRLLSYSRNRVRRVYRHPHKPSGGVGALSPKREADQELALVFLEYEEYHDDTD